MTHRVIFTTQALTELSAMRTWHVRAPMQVQERLEAEMDALIERLARFPRGIQVRYKEFRFAHLPDFPYVLIYSVRGDEVLIYRVHHMRRRTELEIGIAGADRFAG